MKLTYLTYDSQPDKKLVKCFDETRIIDIDPLNLHKDMIPLRENHERN